MGARFFFVFEDPLDRSEDALGGFTCAIYHDQPPSPAMLKQLPAVLFRYRLEGRWAEMSLDELRDEYWRRRAQGTLPSTNMIPPPPPPRAERRIHTPRHVLEELVAKRRRALAR